jgi:1,4-dihydroxy-2-naphthoate octaprenyltransferase
MDKDQSSIGGLKNPPQPSDQLLYISVIMDVLAVVLGLFISPYFAAGVLAYILASRAYSFRGIRLKKFPVLGYLTVVIFQGAVSFWLVYHGASKTIDLRVPLLPMLTSSLLVGGFYPLTQIYQHEEDLKDGVRSISAMLGVKRDFHFFYDYLFDCISLPGIQFYISFGRKGIFRAGNLYASHHRIFSCLGGKNLEKCQSS